tara:strand:- start:160 stop:603 length:444 start_codon:yes stop_codon:yes gene_type:complete
MSNFTYQIIPVAFLFILLLLFLGLKKNKITKNLPLNDKFELNQYDFLNFLESTEKKLLALRELYKQDLIDVKVYIKKTEIVAESIKKVTGKNVSEMISDKTNNIYSQLKSDISEKAKTIQKTSVNNDLDKLISDVDQKIRMGFENER